MFRCRRRERDENDDVRASTAISQHSCCRTTATTKERKKEKTNVSLSLSAESTRRRRRRHVGIDGVLEPPPAPLLTLQAMQTSDDRMMPSLLMVKQWRSQKCELRASTPTSSLFSCSFLPLFPSFCSLHPIFSLRSTTPKV